MFCLPCEIVAAIVSDNVATWTMFAIYNEDFYNYTRNNRKLFINLFTVIEEEEFNITYSIFNRFHREDDLPAVIQYESYDDSDDSRNESTREWWINGMKHRNNDQPAVIYEYASEWWYHGKIHRDNDLPATITCDYQEWYQHGKRHRDNGLPAIIFIEGKREWYINGIRDRPDGLPAIEGEPSIANDCNKEWFINGLHHSTYDNPAIYLTNGTREWFDNGKLHRGNDLPAIITSDGQYWYSFGKRHRDDNKPACIFMRNNRPYKYQWYVNGIFVRQENI